LLAWGEGSEPGKVCAQTSPFSTFSPVVMGRVTPIPANESICNSFDYEEAAESSDPATGSSFAAEPAPIPIKRGFVWIPALVSKDFKYKISLAPAIPDKYAYYGNEVGSPPADCKTGRSLSRWEDFAVTITLDPSPGKTVPFQSVPAAVGTQGGRPAPVYPE